MRGSEVAHRAACMDACHDFVIQPTKEHSMNFTYCYEKAAPPTSALYYTLRKLPVQLRDIIVAIHAFYREIEDVVFECQDHELALIKFNWWRSEVAKLTIGKPDHPVMLALQKANYDLEELQEKLLRIIASIEQIAISTPFATFEDILVHWMHTAGERELLINALLRVDHVVDRELIYQLMLIIEMVNFLQSLRRYVKHNVIYLAVDEMQSFAVTQDDLMEFKTSPQMKKLLVHQAEKIIRAKNALDKLTKQQRKSLSHLVARCEIALVTLEKIKQNDFQVLENWIALTPLHYWWIVQRKS